LKFSNCFTSKRKFHAKAGARKFGNKWCNLQFFIKPANVRRYSSYSPYPIFDQDFTFKNHFLNIKQPKSKALTISLKPSF
jgi:hypothetical protein